MLVTAFRNGFENVTTYGMLESRIGCQPLRRVEHDQLFDKVLGYRVGTTVLSVSKLSQTHSTETHGTFGDPPSSLTFFQYLS